MSTETSAISIAGGGLLLPSFFNGSSITLSKSDFVSKLLSVSAIFFFSSSNRFLLPKYLKYNAIPDLHLKQKRLSVSEYKQIFMSFQHYHLSFVYILTVNACLRQSLGTATFEDQWLFNTGPFTIYKILTFKDRWLLNTGPFTI